MAQIFRVERTQNFTVMSNHHFKNKNLTLKAKGLLSGKFHQEKKMIKWCLLSKLKTLDFTDFCPIFWYNDCKDFDKKKSFFLQFSYRF